MKSFTAAAAVAVLLMATPAFAQTTSQPSEPGTITMTETGHQQTQMTAGGRITDIDLSNGTVTLDNGMQFTLAPSLQYTSFPALGQEVQVTYGEDGGQKVARIIDLGGANGQGGGDQ
jgi:opacity protein-like surface antigen